MISTNCEAPRLFRHVGHRVGEVGERLKDVQKLQGGQGAFRGFEVFLGQHFEGAGLQKK